MQITSVRYGPAWKRGCTLPYRENQPGSDPVAVSAMGAHAGSMVNKDVSDMRSTGVPIRIINKAVTV